MCGNIITAAGEAVISCCGIVLPALEAEQASERCPFPLKVEVDDFGTAVKAHNFGIHVREDKVGSPAEILLYNVLGGDGKFLTVRFHVGHIGVLQYGTVFARSTERSYQVEIVSPIDVERNVDAVVYETEVGTEVEFMLFLISQ